MKRNLLIASVFLVPMASIVPVPGTIVWYPQLLALIIVGLTCASMLFWKLNRFLALFLVYLVFSYVFICGQAPRSMLILILTFAAMFLTYAVTQVKERNLVYKAVVVMGLLNAVYVSAQYFHIDPFFKPTSTLAIDRMVGFMGSRNQLGIFQAIAATLSFSVMPWASLVLVIPLFLVKASTALIGLGVGTISYFLISGYRFMAFLVLIAGLIVIPFFIHGKASEFGERVGLWKLTIKQANQGKAVAQLNEHTKKIYTFSPWFGAGLGKFFEISPMTQGVLWQSCSSARYEHAHNDPVEALFEFGRIGLALLVLCVGGIVGDFIRCLHLLHPGTEKLILSFSSLITLAVCSLGVYIVHAPVSLFVLALMLGLFYAEVSNAKQSTGSAATA